MYFDRQPASKDALRNTDGDTGGKSGGITYSGSPYAPDILKELSTRVTVEAGLEYGVLQLAALNEQFRMHRGRELIWCRRCQLK